MNKYVRITNNERLQKDIELLKRRFGTVNEELAIKLALTLYLADQCDGYNILTGDVEDGTICKSHLQRTDDRLSHGRRAHLVHLLRQK